jgi:hypothetical protein
MENFPPNMGDFPARLASSGKRKRSPKRISACKSYSKRNYDKTAFLPFDMGKIPSILGATKNDLHRNNLRCNALVLTTPRKGRPENQWNQEDNFWGKKKTAQPLVGFERQAWTIKRWSQEIDLSIPTVWVMVKDGRVPSVKIGGRRLIRISPRDYMDACAAAAAAAAG